MADDPKLRVVSSEVEAQISIPKPEEKFSLDRFKSKLDTSGGGVETLIPALPISSIGRAGDFVRLHPDEDNYWTSELCFVNVPIDGQKDRVLHLIDEDVAKRHDLQDKIVRFRLALATKPGNAFFLCRVQPKPHQHLEQDRVRRLRTSQEAVDAGGTQEGAQRRRLTVHPRVRPGHFCYAEMAGGGARYADRANLQGPHDPDRRSPWPLAPVGSEAGGVVSANFSQVVVADFEYEIAEGDLPNVLCMVAYVL